MPDYPYESICDNCGGQIFVYYSKNKKVEYARDSTVYINYTAGERPDYHKCPNWKTKKQSSPTKHEPTPKPVVKKTTSKQIEPEAEPEFETAEATLAFGRTYKVLEVVISKTRKCNEKTIPQLAQYESLDYFISQKAEVEITCDIQRLIREKFAQIQWAIDQEIMADKLRLGGDDEQ